MKFYELHRIGAQVLRGHTLQGCCLVAKQCRRSSNRGNAAGNERSREGESVTV